MSRLSDLDRTTRPPSAASRCLARRARPRRHQETGPDPGAADGGPTAGPARATPSHQGWLRLHPLGHRRLQPAGLLRGTPRRTRRDRGGLLATEPRPSSATTKSRWNGCSPTTAPATAQTTSPTLSELISHTFTRPYRPATNGKAEGSTGPCCRVGLCPDLDFRGSTDPGDLPTGSTSTTITGTTPLSGDRRSSRVGNLTGHYI